ncbi:MAG: hypothetical protein ACE5D3_04825, partial [Candidatus Binatia bacterium]
GLGKTTRAGIAVIESRRRGRNAADHRIVELLADDPRPWEVTVITSDRALRDRVRSLGAKVIGSGSFLRLLDGRSRGPGQ